MKNNIAKLFVAGALLTQATMAFAMPRRDYPSYGQPGYSNGHHHHDGDGTLLLGISATLLSLSAMDSANRSHHIAAIQQAETEALAFDGSNEPSAVFRNAKRSVETLQGQELTDDEAAEMIIELNQEFRN